MIPMVESEAHAKAIVQACRDPPAGRRGAAFGFAQCVYLGGDVGEKIRAYNERTLVIAQIETERGLDQVEKIAAVDGIDVLWVGHFDLTNFMGIPGEFDNPAYLAALKRIVGAAKKHNKGLGFMPASPEWASQYRVLGFNMFGAGTDQGILMNGIKAILSPLSEQTRR